MNRGLKGASLAGFIVLITLGVFFLVFASMTCCCYHKLARRMTWVPATGQPAIGVAAGYPTPSAPPQSTIPIHEAELAKAG